MVTEAGEAADMLKKHIFYGKEYDQVNLVEEIGDMMWYIAVALDEMDVSFEQVMELNLAKLAARYGKAWTQEGAIDRDLDAERRELEK
jgi:NTP pyrophosphatase (non-canonical NTP hydrolase)